MARNDMLGTLATLWEKILNWLAVAGSAHVIDDGSEEKKDRPSERPPTKLRMVPRQN